MICNTHLSIKFRNGVYVDVCATYVLHMHIHWVGGLGSPEVDVLSVSVIPHPGTVVLTTS